MTSSSFFRFAGWYRKSLSLIGNCGQFSILIFAEPFGLLLEIEKEIDKSRSEYQRSAVKEESQKCSILVSVFFYDYTLLEGYEIRDYNLSVNNGRRL